MAEPPKCPQCGESATWQDASGAFWDGNAHYWRLLKQKSAFDQKLHDEGAAILRVAKELREFLGSVPATEPQGQSLLRDCDKLERVGNWLIGVNSITLSNGISTK